MASIAFQGLDNFIIFLQIINLNYTQIYLMWSIGLIWVFKIGILKVWFNSNQTYTTVTLFLCPKILPKEGKTKQKCTIFKSFRCTIAHQPSKKLEFPCFPKPFRHNCKLIKFLCQSGKQFCRLLLVLTIFQKNYSYHHFWELS